MQRTSLLTRTPSPTILSVGFVVVVHNLNNIGVILQNHAQNLRVGQNCGLADVHGHGLAHVLHRGGDIHSDVGLGSAAHAGVGAQSVGVKEHHILQAGLASGQSVIHVGVHELSPLVTDNHTLQLIHAVHGGQDGAVILEADGVAVLVLLNHTAGNHGCA